MPLLVILCLILSAVLSAVEATPPAPEQPVAAAAVSGALGSRTNPVRCDMPAGERAYLARLRDAKGRPIRFARQGSVGVSPYGNILDLYVGEVDGVRVEVYMDMYHQKHVERAAPPGLAIVD